MRFYHKDLPAKVLAVNAELLEALLEAVKGKHFRDVETALRAMSPNAYAAFENFSLAEMTAAIQEAAGEGSGTAILERVPFENAEEAAKAEAPEIPATVRTTRTDVIGRPVMATQVPVWPPRAEKSTITWPDSGQKAPR